MTKKLFSALLVLAVLICTSVTAHAQDIPQERHDCSIEITVRYDGENINGGTLTAIKVGFIQEENGDYTFCRVMDGARLDDIQSADAVTQLREYYENNKAHYEFEQRTVDVSDGKAYFSDLAVGLYLIIQENAATGYSKLNPFLVSVPYLENGQYQYHVTATMKSKLEQETEPKPTEPQPTKPKDPQLPQTGQINWPIPLMVISGLVFFMAGWILRFGSKRERNEK